MSGATVNTDTLRTLIGILYILLYAMSVSLEAC